ncbi:MAG: S-layer protein domain-containing protein, partial [Euryarchaeota archaeon]|nr:S-layer protein domain-containing protein [Euryarchaeota archaeon]
TNVSVVIESYEPAYTNYTLCLRLGGDVVSEQEVGIASCSELVVNMTFTPKMIGSYLPLEFQLLKGDKTHRYDLKTVSCSVDSENVDSAMNYTITPPLIPNGDMEYEGFWKYSGRGNLTGNYTSDAATLGHRSYQIATTNRTVYGDSGTISQDIAGEDGIVLLVFDVMDSQTSDSAGQHTKQVLLNDILVWEGDCAGDDGWQRVETPVILKSNNTLTIAVSEGNVGRDTDLQVWWDNIEFRRFEGGEERETVVAGQIPSVQLSSIPMPIYNGSTMTLTSSNCDQLNYNERLELYFSEDGVVDTENATYTVSVSTSSGSITYLGAEYGCPTSEPDILLPVIVDGSGRTMHANETWDLGSGYNLTIREVDTVSEVALLELNRSHDTINKTLDSGIFGEGEVFEYRTDVGGVDDDTLLFRCTVDDILLDQSVEIDDLYLYSDTPVYVNRGDRYGEFEIDEIKSDKIVFKNWVGIAFSGTCSILNDTIRFKVSDNRRYAYIYTTKTRSGTYRLEGSSYSAEAGKRMNLSGENHPAFCNDPETGASYEELKVYFSSERFIEAENATYTISVIGCETGFLGELHRSFNPDRADFLSKILVNESGDEAEIRLNIGESYVLREDCLLTLKDIFVTGGAAWFELTKEGEVVESSVRAEGGVIEHKVSIAGRDVTVFECTVDTVFHDEERGFVVLKDIKQFSDDVKKINIGDKYGEYGKFKVSIIMTDKIVITNDESITINDETSILDGWLKFDVSGDWVTPYAELQLGG